MKTNNNHVTKETKALFGMNRNEFYEYKKQRCMELAQKGATVGEIAKDLGMTEKEMYAFLSRNFGGVKRMREFAKSGNGIPQVQMAAMSIPTSEKKTKKSNASDTKNSLLSVFGAALANEKEKIISEFKQNIEDETKSVVGEVEMALSQLRSELLDNFKAGLMSDLSEMAATL